jgi:uncharacterized protein YehS (DUF1456 family)
MATKMEVVAAPGDPLASLRYEHRALDGLFAQFAARKEQHLARRICTEVIQHSKLEEDAVYQEVAEIPEVFDKSGKGLEDHRRMAEMVKSIRKLEAGETLNAQMQELRVAVEQHVRDEELSIFPALRKLSKPRLDDLAARLSTAKANLANEAHLTGV